jgi:hypothetical protein
MSAKNISVTLCAGLLLAILAGCNGRPAPVPVSGRVLIDGKPLDRGFIRFVPKGTRASSGTIEKDGRFTLGCFNKNDGALRGIHAVEVVAIEEIGLDRVRYYIPEKYAHTETSGVVVNITGPTDDVTIELTWDGGKPFERIVRGG